MIHIIGVKMDMKPWHSKNHRNSNGKPQRTEAGQNFVP
jgi:hypothetical protein